MSEIIRDSGLTDFPFCIVDSDIVDLVNRLKAYECTERTVDMVSLAGFFSDFIILGHNINP